jgi:aspartate ammonia-lyase
MSEVRKEKDSLGFVEVPSRAYYGAQTARAVENFPISGMRAHPQLIRALGMVKRAAAEANKELGLVDQKRQVEWRVRGRCISGRRGGKPAHEQQ